MTQKQWIIICKYSVESPKHGRTNISISISLTIQEARLTKQNRTFVSELFWIEAPRLSYHNTQTSKTLDNKVVYNVRENEQLNLTYANTYKL